MGAAAEISEFIQLAAGNLLDEEPSLRIRVEIERLKRFSYLGFERATRSAGERVLGFIERHKDQLNPEHRLVWESVVATSNAWFINDSNELQLLIDRCRQIDVRFDGSSTLRDLCASFMYALEGRHAALTGDVRRCQGKFGKATDLCRSRNLSTPLAHIIIRYAESLVVLKEWEQATTLMRNFLLSSNESPKRLFRSHLLLRAILILLEAPETVVPPEEFKYNAFRYHILVYATGLAPSQALYPLLDRTRKVVSLKSAAFDIYHLDWRDELCRQIRKLGSRDFERLIKFLYESLSYKVIDLPSSFQAFDHLAVFVSSEGKTDVLGIQVKANLVEDVNKGINKIEEEAYRLLELRVKQCFGDQCQLSTVELDELVNILLDKPEILKRVVFSNQWKTPSKEQSGKKKSDDSRSNTARRSGRKGR